MNKFMKNWNGISSGFSLLEVLCSLAILGITVIGIFSVLSTSIRTTDHTDERQTAKNLAESQIEFVKIQDYATVYSPMAISPEYSSYSSTVEVSNIPERDANIQKITITILHHGEEVRKLEGYKVN